jgi:hypothetical protein
MERHLFHRFARRFRGFADRFCDFIRLAKSAPPSLGRRDDEALKLGDDRSPTLATD